MTDKQNYFTYTDNTSDDNDKTMENLHKQTIIDGVDVSGCECYSEHREGYCGWFTPCEGDSCQYKLDWALQQLKRKEQEYEELKSARDSWISKCEQETKIKELYQEQLDQLKAENDKLKEIMHKDFCTHYVLGECSQKHHNNCVGRNQCIKDLEQEIEELKIYIESNKQQVKEVETLVMDNDRLINELTQYKQTLTDIKEITEDAKTKVFVDMEEFWKQILQKISECEVTNE